ncbi:antitoxin Xre/MbcA/ParS toxin-binding domain-containing protein [Azospirillum argentinense]|nr:antitoxin Xre/MbcA/ParS toxin-binding domain-containing protein [Azospirillum argentinense]
MAGDSITSIIRSTILTANVDDSGPVPVTLQHVLESGILAEVSNPDAVMRRIADRLAAEIAGRLEGVIPPAKGAASAAPVGPFRDETRAEIVAASRPRHFEITRESMAKALEALDFWGASDEQAKAILGAGLHGVLLGWRRDVVIETALDNADVSARLTAVVVIIHHLGRLYADPEDVLHWVRSPCAALGGATPLEHMASGRIEDLEEVRVHLRRVVEENCDSDG